MIVEIRNIENSQVIYRLDDMSPPDNGTWFSFNDQQYLVMKLSHRYKLLKGTYHLYLVSAYVRICSKPIESNLWKGIWIVGNPNCIFNALHPIIRCAVVPSGPCSSCSEFKSRAT